MEEYSIVEAGSGVSHLESQDDIELPFHSSYGLMENVEEYTGGGVVYMWGCGRVRRLNRQTCRIQNEIPLLGAYPSEHKIEVRRAT